MSTVIASLLVSGFFGFRGAPYINVVIVGFLAAGMFLWSTRDAIRESKKHAYGAESVPRVYTGFVTLLLYIALTVVSLAINLGVYFLARSISGS